MPLPAQTLPKKEDNLFRTLSRLHEKKQYKKALRSCDEILRVNKSHGETLAMKGLTYNFLGKKEEAHKFVKLGIANNVMSAICWHVYGLLHRSDGNYQEAKKCYFNAMKRDKTNLHILQDLSLLQIQLRDISGFLKTRKALLHLKSTRPDSWYTFCMAWELLGSYNEAIDVMKSFEDITEGSELKKKGKIEPSFETGERKLYIAQLYEKAGRYQEAIKYLKDFESAIVDKHGRNMVLANLYVLAGDQDSAKQLYRALIEVNPENYDLHLGLQKAYQLGSGTSFEGFADDQISELAALYDQLRVSFPRCSALKTIPLRFHKAGDSFQKELDFYLQPALRKGVPSLFATLQYFYENNEAKAKMIGDTILSYYQSLKSSGKFPGCEADELSEPPTSTMWTILFLAQHFSELGQPDKALEFIDEAIAHTPTVVDIYLFKAEIYKKVGALQKAADVIDECRELDLADRYLNSKCTVYLMDADRVEQADETIKLFTADADGVCVDLTEMQCVWYEQAAADSYLRTGANGKSLKKSLAICKHSEEFVEDQFDFHSYCMRKLTLRAYRDLLSFADKIYSHDNYFHGACTTIKNYLVLNIPIAKQKEKEIKLTGLSGKELEIAQKKKKKAELKKEKQEEKKREEKEKIRAQRKKAGKEEDPDCELLTDIKNPLEKAAIFATSLEKWCPDRLESHLLSFEVFFAKEKYFRALKALKKSISMAPQHPVVHTQLIQLCLADVSAFEESLSTVFKAELDSITNGASAVDINTEYAKNNTNYLSRVYAARARQFIQPGDLASSKDQICVVDSNASLNDTTTVYQLVRDVYGNETAAEFATKAKEVFPFASAFEISTQ